MLCVADMYLLPGLKRLCGKTLAKTICEDNVLYMWKMAKLFRLSRLEDQCTEFMAKIIERVGVYFPMLRLERVLFGLDNNSVCDVTAGGSRANNTTCLYVEYEPRASRCLD